MTTSPMIVLVLIGAGAVALGLFMYRINEVAASRADRTIRDVRKTPSQEGDGAEAVGGER